MEIRVPHLGEGADSGSVVNILVKEGDVVRKDQALIELENEKAVAPIPSTHAGAVVKIFVKVGEKVTVGQRILELAVEGAPDAAPPEPSHPSDEVVAPQGAAAGPAPLTGPVPLARHVGVSAPYLYSSPSGFPPPASPTVRRIAQDLGIDLRKVRGSEAGGRIVLADLRAYVDSLEQAAAAPASPVGGPASPKKSEAVDFSKWGPVRREPLSPLRQKIGERMSEAWASIPHVTQFDEADITALMALRKKHAPFYEKKKARLTLTAFVMKTCAAALKAFPRFNSSLDEGSGALVYKGYVHLGVAVDTEAGLIVPVLRDANQKSLLEISLELESLAERTRQRKVSADELKGGTFTISNLGGIGGTFFTPIVNKPEVAILGVGRGVLKLVPPKGRQKSQAARLMLPLALSYDHRVIDGADGARFIRAIAEGLENFGEKDVKL